MAQTQNGYFVLRRVDTSRFTGEAWIRQLEMEGQAGTYVEIDRQGEYFDDDRPRDTEFTSDIMDHTLGFTLFDPNYRPVGSYRSLDKALRAVDSVKVTFTTDVELDDEDEEVAAEPTSQLGQAMQRQQSRSRRMEATMTTDANAPAG